MDFCKCRFDMLAQVKPFYGALVFGAQNDQVVLAVLDLLEDSRDYRFALPNVTLQP